MSRVKSALVLARHVVEDRRRLSFARVHAKESLERLEGQLRESEKRFNAIRAELTAAEKVEFDAGWASVRAMIES